jgi:hypothetical protein
MAGNTGDGHRKGAVSNRTQSYNSKTDSFVKRDSITGKILACKKGEPFKGVTLKEKTKLK